MCAYKSGLTYTCLCKLREVLTCITLKDNLMILYKFSLFHTQENTTFCYWYHREEKGRDHVCVVLPYPFSDITMQYSANTELLYTFILKMCCAINTVDPTFVNERTSLSIFTFSIARDIRYLYLRPVSKRSVDAKMLLKTISYYSGADDNFLCWVT